MSTQNMPPILGDRPTGNWFDSRNHLISRYMLYIAAFHKLQHLQNSSPSWETFEINDQDILGFFPHLKKDCLRGLCVAHGISSKQWYSRDHSNFLLKLRCAMIQDRGSTWDGRNHDSSFPDKRKKRDISDAKERIDALSFVLEVPTDDMNVNDENIPQRLGSAYWPVQDLYSLFLEVNVKPGESKSIIESTLREIAEDHDAWLWRFTDTWAEESRGQKRKESC